jgi:hypothetical protein
MSASYALRILASAAFISSSSVIIATRLKCRTENYRSSAERSRWQRLGGAQFWIILGATRCMTGASNATVRPYNRMAMSSIKALTGLRIAVGALFLIFGEYKVVGTQFTLGGGFQYWINRFLQDGAYPQFLGAVKNPAGQFTTAFTGDLNAGSNAANIADGIMTFGALPDMDLPGHPVLSIFDANQAARSLQEGTMSMQSVLSSIPRPSAAYPSPMPTPPLPSRTINAGINSPTPQPAPTPSPESTPSRN